MPSRFQLNQHITNLFTLNVRGENITHQSSLGENKSLWRFKKNKKNKKKQPWNLFSVQPLLHIWESSKLGVTSLTLTLGGCEGAEKRGSGPGDCSAEIESDQSDPFRMRGWKWDQRPWRREVHPKLCVGCMTETLGVELLPFLLLLHSKLLGLVRCWELVNQCRHTVCWNDQSCERNKRWCLYS